MQPKPRDNAMDLRQPQALRTAQYEAPAQPANLMRGKHP